ARRRCPVPRRPDPRSARTRRRGLRRRRMCDGSRLRYSTRAMPERRYLVKEMFGPTLQGEGAHAGRAVVFLRFAACNLACPGCDTDFSPEGARRYAAEEIVARLRELDTGRTHRVIVTGGEPTLQWDAELASVVRG